MAKAKRKNGRPRAKIDWNMVGEMCEIQCTGVEIAKVLGIHYDTIANTCKRDHGVTFSEWSDEKREFGRTSLRRKQFRAAVTDGNITMMIWLGKQWLGQKDKQELSGGLDNTTTVTDLRDMSKDELKAIIHRGKEKTDATETTH